MPDTNYITNVMTDLTALNEVYKVSKERVDRIVNDGTVSGSTVSGSTAAKYATKIGSSSQEGTVTLSSIGDASDPVYVHNGVITPLFNASQDNTVELGNSRTTDVYLGGSSSSKANVHAKDITATNDISATRDISASHNITAAGTVKGTKLEANSTDGVFIGSAGTGVTLKYDSTLNSLVFEFSSAS